MNSKKDKIKFTKSFVPNGKKGGVSWDRLLLILILLVSFVLIVAAVKNFIDKAEPYELEVACRGSMALRAHSAINTMGTEIKWSPLLCKTQDLYITAGRDKIYVMDQLADLMGRCWWMFNEGRYNDVVSDTELKILPEFTAKNGCFLCYTVGIKAQKFDPFGKGEFLAYLNSQNHPSIKDMTYMKYFQEHGGAGNVRILPTSSGEDVFAPGKVYGVAFVSKSFDTSWYQNVFANEPNIQTSTIIVATLDNLKQNNQDLCFGGDIGDIAGN
ncbi:hypothetical protein HOC13_02915 [Candidatus Woesearchaeota archaeon]|jgi:hypothetical protein|nr:hypothetical protein [Candidatus Woesearchaeota archaeon]